MTPDVTVVVISYNDAARLPRAIRSIQRQTLRSLEIVVVDDGSRADELAKLRVHCRCHVLSPLSVSAWFAVGEAMTHLSSHTVNLSSSASKPALIIAGV